MMIQWQLQMFGDLRLFHAAQDGVRLRTRKTEALLAYLALFPHSHTREHLADVFWESSGSQEARNSLSVALHGLRSTLKTEEGTARSLVLADSTTVRLDASLLSIDVARFEQEVNDAAKTNDEERRLAHLHAALALRRAPLLPAFFDAWIGAERDRLEIRAQDAMRQIVQILAKQKEFSSALDYALQAAALDPLHEANCRDIMRLQTAVGNPHAALRHYRTFAQQLQEEMRLAPSASTVALAEQITRTTPAAPPTVSVTAPQTATLDRFVGRETEQSALTRWLEEGRANAESSTLITLTGIGGVGKTRLSKEVARHCTPLFGKHIHFFNLAEETDADCLFETLCRELRLPRRTDTDPLEQLAGVFSTAPALLILDNFEQIVEEGGQQVQTLRERIPNCSLLVTSRRRLNIAGEREFVLYPLPTPALTAAESVSSLESLGCVQLFVARCRQHQADFAVTSNNAETIAQVCARLEGLPLALELAAAWLRVLSLPQLLARLERRFDLLVSDRRDLPNRHRSLRAAIEGSYRLLSPEARRFFTRLSVFAGTWDLDAALAVCGDDALALLAVLQDASLVATERDAEGTPRFRLLETLREFAAEQLTEEDRTQTQIRYIAHFLMLAEQANLILRGMEARRGYGRLEREHDNFRNALALCFAPDSASPAAPQGDIESGIRLTIALMKFWHLRGYQPEWERWLPLALSASGSGAATLELRAALYLEIFEADLYWEDTGFAEQARELGEHLQHLPLMAMMKLLSFVTRPEARLTADALPVIEDALALLRQTDRQSLLGYALNWKAILLCQQGSAEANAAFDAAIAVLRQADASYHLVTSLFDAAFYATGSDGSDAAERAEALLHEAIDICTGLEHHSGRAHGLWILGKVVRGRDMKRAEACFRESLELHQRCGFSESRSLPIFELGYTALLQANYVQAREFFLEACAVRPAIEKEEFHLMLIWCALGEGNEAAFRFHAGEHLRHRDGTAEALGDVGMRNFFAAVHAGNFPVVRPLYAELVRLWNHNPDLISRRLVFLPTARWMAEEKQFGVASQLLGMEAQMRWETWSSRLPLETQLLEQTETLLRTSLPESEQAAFRAEGGAMTAEMRRSFLLALLDGV